MSTLAKAMSSKFELHRAINRTQNFKRQTGSLSCVCVLFFSKKLTRAALRESPCSFFSRPSRVPSGGGPAAGVGRQGGQPEPSPAAGEGGGGAGRQSGAAAGEQTQP